MRKRPLPPHLKRWFERRTNKTYLQFRKRGHKTVPLPQPIDSDECWQAYNTALKGTSTVGADLRSIAGSVSAAIAAYYSSPNGARWRKAHAARDGLSSNVSARSMDNGRCVRWTRTF